MGDDWYWGISRFSNSGPIFSVLGVGGLLPLLGSYSALQPQRWDPCLSLVSSQGLRAPCHLADPRGPFREEEGVAFLVGFFLTCVLVGTWVTEKRPSLVSLG